VVRYEGLREMVVEVVPDPGREPKIAVFSGTKLALSTRLAHRVLELLNAPDRWAAFPDPIREWLDLQRTISRMPRADRLLAESFARGGRHFLCLHGFAGRNAHQTLGLILTKRMEEAGLEPLGFVATDASLLVWGLRETQDVAPLLDPQGLRDGLETWLAGNAVMKRTFRSAARIAGLLERTLPGRRRSGRQATFSSDILYDTLRRHDPGHLMLRITREEAMRGLVDFDRIEELLARTTGIDHVRAPHLTPLAAPLLLEMGKVPIHGLAEERLLAAEAAALMAEAGLAGP
jgi:ATP-dependent Lhr-like helicase